jgi:hypothetical protein
MHSEGSISIWFFIGISLFGNGLLILAAGLYELAHPPLNPSIVLFSLHANVWWGALLLIAGAFYCYHFRPGKQS